MFLFSPSTNTAIVELASAVTLISSVSLYEVVPSRGDLIVWGGAEPNENNH